MSNNTHLRQQAGGDPARSVSNDLKNPTKAPQDGNDFPDAPENTPDARPQDKPDLDAFAKKLGTDQIESGDGLDAVTDGTTDTTAGPDARMIIAGGGAVVAVLMVLFARRRRKRRHLLSKAVALGTAVDVIRD